MNSKNNGAVLLSKTIDIVSPRLLQWIARIENGLNNIKASNEKSDFEVVYGGTCMTRSGRSVRDHDQWCVWIYEAGVILMVIRLNLICT